MLRKDVFADNSSGRKACNMGQNIALLQRQKIKGI
jgi:hypothetical protein